VADWKFVSKIHLSPSSFLSIGLPLLRLLQNSILIPKFILLIFQFFFGWRREMRLPDSDLKKRNVCWWGIRPPKRLFFYVKWFHMMRGVNTKCFFTSKTPKNHILGQKVFFFCFGWILGFRVTFYVFLAMNWFNKVFRVLFPKSFVQKKKLKMSFWVNKQGLCFSDHYSGWIMRMNKQRVVCLVKIK